MATEISVGLLGAGRIGRVHAEYLAFRIPAANLVAVADILTDVEATAHAGFTALAMNVLSRYPEVEWFCSR
jgi:predicted homoserine dehydrogenase-like protein